MRGLAAFHEKEIAPDHVVSEILDGLSTRPRHISPKFFYDECGSRLFDAICELPEYYPTRTEMSLLESSADEIGKLAGSDVTLIELGSGASKKIRLLLDAVRPRRYVGVDISREFLRQSTESLAQDFPWLEVRAACADFMHDLDLRPGVGDERKLIFFPGSTIGNLEPNEAADFLARVHRLAQPDGALLIGVDLKKDPVILNAAYNDRAGITAKFNLNLLWRLRNEFGFAVNPHQFAHQAFYNGTLGRIEMHLLSCCAQTIQAYGRCFDIASGESIHTENSYKYSVDEFQSMARAAGFVPRQAWVDSARLFSVHYVEAAG